jgi:hypothetical protein
MIGNYNFPWRNKQLLAGPRAIADRFHTLHFCEDRGPAAAEISFGIGFKGTGESNADPAAAFRIGRSAFGLPLRIV